MAQRDSLLDMWRHIKLRWLEHIPYEDFQYRSGEEKQQVFSDKEATP